MHVLHNFFGGCLKDKSLQLGPIQPSFILLKSSMIKPTTSLTSCQAWHHKINAMFFYFYVLGIQTPKDLAE